MKTQSFFGLILFSSFLDAFALHSTRPIISIYASHLGASPFIIGMLVSAFAIFPMVFAIRFGKWTDHLGVKKMMVFGGLGCLFALLIPIALPNILGLVLSQIAMGLGHNGIMTATLTGVTLAPLSRDQAFAWQATVFSIGEFLGPLSSGFLYEHFGFRLTLGVSALSIAVFIVLNLLIRVYPPVTKNRKPHQTGDTFALLKNANIRRGVVVSGMAVYSRDIFTAYFPIYGTSIHMSPSEIGITLSIVAIATATVRVFQFALIARFSRQLITSACMLIAGSAFVLTPFMQKQWILFLLAALLGMGVGVLQPLALGYLVQFAPPGREGELIGMRSMFNRLSQLTAPLFFGLIGGSLGVQPILWSCGLTLIGGAWYSKEKTSREQNAPENTGAE